MEQKSKCYCVIVRGKRLAGTEIKRTTGTEKWIAQTRH